MNIFAISNAFQSLSLAISLAAYLRFCVSFAFDHKKKCCGCAAQKS